MRESEDTCEALSRLIDEARRAEEALSSAKRFWIWHREATAAVEQALGDDSEEFKYFGGLPERIRRARQNSADIIGDIRSAIDDHYSFILTDNNFRRIMFEAADRLRGALLHLERVKKQ